MLALLAKLNITPKFNELHDHNPQTEVRLFEFNNARARLQDGVVDCIPWYAAKGLEVLGFRDGELIEFSFQTLGLGVLGGGLWVHPDKLKDRNFQDALARFVSVSMRGWRFAEFNEAETLDIVLAAMGVNANEAGDMRGDQTVLLRGMLKQIDGSSGLLDADDYQRSVDILRAGGVLHAPPQGAWTHAITDKARIYSEAKFSELSAKLKKFWHHFILELLDVRSVLIHLGWLLAVWAMCMREQTTLRILITMSSVVFIADYMFVHEVYASVVWAFLMVLPNLWYLFGAAAIGKFYKFTPEEEDMRRLHMADLSKYSYRKLTRKGGWHTAEKGQILHTEERRVTHWVFIASGAVEIEKHGEHLGRMPAPHFSGHLAISENRPAAWTVKAEKGTRYWMISAEQVRALMERDNEINRVLTAVFYKGVAQYVAHLRNYGIK